MKTVNKIVIFYFSGTGNAKQVALWFSKFAKKKNIDCQIFNIAKTKTSAINSIKSNALTFIISPIHGFNYPKITLDFIRHFPKGKNKIVLMNTRAGMKIGRFVTPGLTGIAFMFSSILLKLKGYKIVGQIPFDMPSNWISVHPALNLNTVKYLHQQNYKRVAKHATILFSGKTDFFAYRDLIQDILISPIALGYYFFGRFAFAKSFYATIDCDNCEICIKQCPVKAIKSVVNRPYWTYKCESCMKCMNTCPKDAIETAHGLFIVTSLGSSTILAVLINGLLKFNIESELLRLSLSTLIFFVLLFILYRLQHLLLRNKFVGRIISFASLTHFKFWGRYKSIPDYKWKNKSANKE